MNNNFTISNIKRVTKMQELDERFYRTALHEAASAGHQSVVELLLKYPDIDVNATDWDHRTPLHEAAFEGHQSVVELLLKYPDIDVNATDWDERTALHEAASAGHQSVVELLLESSGIDVNVKDWNHRTALHEAAFKDHQSVVELLLESSGIDVNVKDWNHRTALHEAAFKDHQSVVELLLKYPDIDVNATDWDERTALHKASSAGHQSVVELLLESSDIDVNVKDKMGRTALHEAAFKDHQSVVELLLESSDIDVNVTGLDGKAALHEAAFKIHQEICKRLLEQGAQIKGEAVIETLQKFSREMDVIFRTQPNESTSEEHQEICKQYAQMKKDAAVIWPLQELFRETNDIVLRTRLIVAGLPISPEDIERIQDKSARVKAENCLENLKRELLSLPKRLETMESASLTDEELLRIMRALPKIAQQTKAEYSVYERWTILAKITRFSPELIVQITIDMQERECVESLIKSILSTEPELIIEDKAPVASEKAAKTIRVLASKGKIIDALYCNLQNPNSEEVFFIKNLHNPEYIEALALPPEAFRYTPRLERSSLSM